MDESRTPRPDEPRPVRSTLLTAALFSIGVIGAPIAILGVALAADSVALQGQGGVLFSIGVIVVLGLVVSMVRTVRPLGVGMLAGAAALVLMYLLTGGPDDTSATSEHPPRSTISASSSR